jgi:hypothetical protein
VSIEQITQDSLDAYNAQDLDLYCSFFTDDIVVADINGAVNLEGLDAYRDRYAGAFAKFPKNRADLKNRIVLANTVIDHEFVDRGDGVTPTFEVAAIYTFRDGKIARVDFAK